MKILLLSNEGDGLGIAHHLSMEGHAVKVYVKDKQKVKDACKGIVKHVAEWRPHVADSDLVISDMIGFGKNEKLFKNMGIPVFACNEFVDMVEFDRAKGIQLFRRTGVTVPFTKTYQNPQEARELLTLNDEFPGYVIKPHDNQSTSKTLVVHEAEAFDWAIDLYKGVVTIQEVVKGIEVSTEGWFNGRDWITPFNHTFEEKRFMECGGANTGCMGNVVMRSDGDRLVEHTVQRITSVLRKVSYKGPIDINCIVTKDAAYALEFTSRLGYDAIEALLEGLQEPIADLFFETATGAKKEMALGKDPTIAVRLTKAPWPMDKPDPIDKGMPILGITDENIKHIWFNDIYKDKDGCYLYAAGDGVICKATAHGRTVPDAVDRVYRTVNAIKYPDKQYRGDIGKRVPGDVQQLKAWGWL